MTSVLTGALLIVHLLARALRSGVGLPHLHPAGWWMLPFLAYAAANVFWVTPVRWLGWRDWYGWAEMLAVFWIVLNDVRSAAPRRLLFATLVTLGITAVFMASYQRFVDPKWLMLGRTQAEQFVGRSSGPFGIPNSLGAFLLLLLPVCGAMMSGRGVSAATRVLFGWLTVVFAFGFVLTISRGAWIGLVLALSVWPLFVSNGSWRKRALAALGTLTVLLALCGALYALSPAVHARLTGLVRDRGEITRPIMWRGAWRIFREHPAVGGGAGSYNVLFEKFRPEGFRDEPQWAHNDYLNTLSDYGLVGLGLFFGGCTIIAWRCVRGRCGVDDGATDRFASSKVMTALAIGLLAFALQLFVDFHFKIPALAMVFAVIAALVVQRRWPVRVACQPSSIGRGPLLILAAGAVLGMWFFVVPLFRAEALRYRARQRIDRLAGMSVDAPDYRAQLAESRAELARAVAIDPANAQAWSDTAYAAALWGHISRAEVPELGREAEAAASRALALTPACAEFWIRRGVARDMQGRWFDASVDMARATTLAPNAGWVWFYYADHMNKKRTERGLTEAALALCLRLDPQNQEGLVLRQQLAITKEPPP
ncbi:MAG TPA: O-antigen ligase family protein [Opitutaceae bacterium]|nr:O-antigen ligase family protein [Opitutaceae bacterium]